MEDTVIRMGFAIRNYAVEKGTNSAVEEFGMHTRYGFFDMIVHSDFTTSYWGIFVSGAQSTIASVATLVSLLVLLSTF